jgi:hypothetical protein
VMLKDGGVYTQELCWWHFLPDGGEIPKHTIRTHAAGHSHCTDLVELLVNPNNPDLVNFTRERELPGSIKPVSFGFTLHHSTLAKFLQVVPNSRLTWREHVNFKVKAHKSLQACRRASGVMWGLRPKVVYWLYASFIWPFITFVSLVWWPCRIQRLVCLGITGAMHTTVTDAMGALPFLHLIYWFRVRQGQLHFHSVVWGADPTFTSVKGTAVHWCCFRSWMSHLPFL